MIVSRVVHGHGRVPCLSNALFRAAVAVLQPFHSKQADRASPLVAESQHAGADSSLCVRCPDLPTVLFNVNVEARRQAVACVLNAVAQHHG